jgi:hypothetical protein
LDSTLKLPLAITQRIRKTKILLRKWSSLTKGTQRESQRWNNSKRETRKIWRRAIKVLRNMQKKISKMKKKWTSKKKMKLRITEKKTKMHHLMRFLNLTASVITTRDRLKGKVILKTRRRELPKMNPNLKYILQKPMMQRKWNSKWTNRIRRWWVRKKLEVTLTWDMSL